MIIDENERDFVLDMADNASLSGTCLWVGATDYFGSEGVYEWISGEPWAWADTNWAPSEPTAFMYEDCICMRYEVSNTGKFKDDFCTTLYNFICEYNIVTDSV